MKHTPLIDRLQQWLIAAPRQLSQLPLRELETKPRPEKWSGKEILGHLIDSARYNLERFVRVPLANGPYQVSPYPQDELVRINAYQELPFSHLLALWSALNSQIAEVWQRLTASDLGRPVILPPADDLQEVDLYWLMDDYLRHLEHHLRQLSLQSPESSLPTWQWTVAAATRALERDPQGRRFVELARWGKLEVEYYAPQGRDLQSPHERDEAYLIIRGTGLFQNGDEEVPFGPGDLLFVPARQEHRFVEFSADFATWVLFVD